MEKELTNEKVQELHKLSVKLCDILGVEPVFRTREDFDKFMSDPNSVLKIGFNK